MSIIKPPATRPDSAFIDALFASEVADQGFVSGHTAALSLNAEAYEAWEGLSAAVHRSMGTRRYELVTLAAARALGSTHCRLAHGRKALGVFDREQLLRIARDYRTAGLDEAEVAMMEFAERVSDSPATMTDADSGRLRELGLSDREIVDVVLAAAARNFYSRAVQALAIPVDPVDLDEELREALLAGLPPGPGYREPLARAHEHALRWLDSVPTRRVAPSVTADELDARFAGLLPEGPTDAAAVVDELAAMCEPGLMGIGSGRFFGWVMGGVLPAALAADWLASAWDQNAAMRFATPAAAAVEGVAGRWILELLGLPASAAVGFTTGGTVANFVGLAAGRQSVLDDAGWDLALHGLSGSPRITVLVGEERHGSIDLALRYLGLGAPTVVPSDDQGRILVEELARALAGVDGPAIVCLQAGNLHSGAFDPMREAIHLAHGHGAWVHVDGAFGLWAATSPHYRDALDGIEGADSWATDAHKTLNVPYDCGVAIVARPELLQAAFGLHTSYIIQGEHAVMDPFEKVPEMSRRARELPVWAALRSLGRSGAVALVERLAANARALAAGMLALPGVEVLNTVAFTQVCLSFGSDERTRRVAERVMAEGAVWMSGSRWQDREVLRISVSNWSTGDADVAAAVAAVERALAAEVSRQARPAG
jgi:uncharacterized peroxidase-related enzyme